MTEKNTKPAFASSIIEKGSLTLETKKYTARRQTWPHCVSLNTWLIVSLFAQGQRLRCQVKLHRVCVCVRTHGSSFLASLLPASHRHSSVYFGGFIISLRHSVLPLWLNTKSCLLENHFKSSKIKTAKDWTVWMSLNSSINIQCSSCKRFRFLTYKRKTTLQ